MLDCNCDVVAWIDVVAIVTLVTEQQKSHDESPERILSCTWSDYGGCLFLRCCVSI